MRAREYTKYYVCTHAQKSVMDIVLVDTGDQFGADLNKYLLVEAKERIT